MHLRHSLSVLMLAASVGCKCDLFVFRNSKMAIKSSFRKNRTPAPR